jgi:hypothetical protein
MKDLAYNGAYYIGLEAGETPDLQPVQLDGQTYAVGARFAHLGNPKRKRSSFEMRIGWELVFQGWFGKYILFSTHSDNHPEKPRSGKQLNLFSIPVAEIYYAFGYVDDKTLVLPGSRGCSDIRF